MGKEAATLIGDLVASRDSADRGRLHERVAAALARINAEADPVTPLRITIGDEYQGAFADVAAAARAALHLRLALLPSYDVRHGLGLGEVTTLQEEPRVEDGPGWWSARDAIEQVARTAERPATRDRRTSYRAAAGVDGPDPAWVESVLVLLDATLAGLSGRSVSVLRGLLQGRTQREIAADLGISASAVSQRVRADGLTAVVAVDELLQGGHE